MAGHREDRRPSKTDLHMRIQRFFENKDRLIDRLESLTSEQKKEIKSFFSKHPSYESKIDWNDKSLSYKDFGPILALDGKSKTQTKKKGIVGLTPKLSGVKFAHAEDRSKKWINWYKEATPKHMTISRNPAGEY